MGAVHEDDLYEAMDWVIERQASVENALAARHLEAGTLVLYDLTSTYLSSGANVYVPGVNARNTQYWAGQSR